MARTPKHEKEAFHKGHTGTSHAEVASLVLCLHLCIILGEMLKGWLGLLASASRPLTPSRRWCAVLVEVLVVVVPQVLLSTELLPAVHTCSVLLALLAPMACVRLAQSVGEPRGAGSKQLDSQISDASGGPSSGNTLTRGGSEPEEDLVEAMCNITSQRCRYISAFRGALMLGTCTCILAVDFRVFPRRFSKTEAYGTGFMDIGTGAVVLASGLVARIPASTGGHQQPIAVRVGRAVKAAAPCWLLWGLRLVSLQTVDYQEAEGEYGVHWNFFATIAFVALARQLVPASEALLPTLIVAGAALHQAGLSAGWSAWARSPTRDPSSVISLNKEGIVSLPGYWVTAMAGSTIAAAIKQSMIEPCAQVMAKLKSYAARAQYAAPITRWALLRPFLPAVGAMALLDGALWALLIVLEATVEPVCRRCANATFVVWLCALCVLMLLVMLVGQLLLPGGLQPLLPQAASNNMLPLFLVANLLTGAVNLSIDTLQVQDGLARVILGGYLCVLCFLLAVLSNKRR